jgi:hypothetical protein
MPSEGNAEPIPIIHGTRRYDANRLASTAMFRIRAARVALQVRTLPGNSQAFDFI